MFAGWHSSTSCSWSLSKPSLPQLMNLEAALNRYSLLTVWSPALVSVQAQQPALPKHRWLATIVPGCISPTAVGCGLLDPNSLSSCAFHTRADSAHRLCADGLVQHLLWGPMPGRAVALQVTMSPPLLRMIAQEQGVHACAKSKSHPADSPSSTMSRPPWSLASRHAWQSNQAPHVGSYLHGCI